MMKIDGKEYELSPRRTSDVLNISAAVVGKDIDAVQNILITAQAICDSLKATGRKLGLFRGFRYRRFSRNGAAIRLTDSLTMQEVFAAWDTVNELEGNKKKVHTESQSAGTSPGE